MDRVSLLPGATIACKREEVLIAPVEPLSDPEAGAAPRGRRPRRVLFYLYSLGSGGAERVIALLASGLAARGDHVTLVVQSDAAREPPVCVGGRTDRAD